MQVTFDDGSIEQYADHPFAGGKEGDVFLSFDGRSVVKLYRPDSSQNEIRKIRLETLMKEHNPTTKDSYWSRFLAWPEKLVIAPRIGFRMRYIGKMKSLGHYTFPKTYNRLPPEDKGWFIGHIASAIHLVNVARLFSTMGLCYPDFSHKNIMIEPFSGNMVLIDCDSLTHKDRSDKLPPTVQGTSWYRAPELVSGREKYPSVKTDRHALAVILYYWLLARHPLIGDRPPHSEDADRDDELTLGQEALYIEHPTDLSNRAAKQTLKASALGPELENLFRKAFVEGLHYPDKRPLPYQWLEALRRTYDRIIPCESKDCDWHFFVVTPTSRLTCPRCLSTLLYPEVLPFLYLLKHRGSSYDNDYNLDTTRSHYVVGWPGRTLHQWHIISDATPMHSSKASQDMKEKLLFEFEPTTSTWYLKNLALPELVYSQRGDRVSTWQPCPVGSCILLIHSMLLQFGQGPEHYRASIHLQEIG
ncbi:MAG TPA: hypothetical protein VN207_12950 [Ktedonobacteraceae bacterium]|nr:hypothetical protein [Ktedonobacteraceae bacterium]